MEKKSFNVLGVTWNDCTSYSQGDKERKPTGFDCKIGSMRISVTNNHIYHKGEFVFHCHDLKFECYPLKTAETHEQAATMAIELCKAKLTQMLSHFP